MARRLEARLKNLVSRLKSSQPDENKTRIVKFGYVQLSSAMSSALPAGAKVYLDHR